MVYTITDLVYSRCCLSLKVFKCFQSERSSGQSLQFLRPTHQNFNFISVSGRFGRIFCPFFMARIQFPHKSSALTASFFRVRQPPNSTFVLSCPTAEQRLPCGCGKDVKAFRPLRPGLDTSEIVVLFLCLERAFHRSRICVHRVQILHVRSPLVGEYALELLYLQLPCKFHHYVVQQLVVCQWPCRIYYHVAEYLVVDVAVQLFQQFRTAESRVHLQEHHGHLTLRCKE